MIMSVESTSSLTVDRVLNNSLSDVKYRISDPLDIEYGAMMDVFLRFAEYQMGMLRRIQDLASLKQFKDEALMLAREADARTSAPRSVDTEGTFSRRLAYMPTGADED
jgi:hypothetical protein